MQSKVRARLDQVTAERPASIGGNAGSLDRPMMPRLVGVLNRFRHGAARDRMSDDAVAARSAISSILISDFILIEEMKSQQVRVIPP